ncbi:MAG: helix-turn-helix transcriptional regulator, partial [Christensenella sp.]
MDFIQKIEKLLSNQKSTVNSMCKELQLGKNSMINWKERGNLPNGDTIVKLAHYFNVSADYLLGIAPPTVFEEELSADEKELIAVYQLLNARGRARTLTVAYEEQD